MKTVRIERIKRKTWAGVTKYNGASDFIGATYSLKTGKVVTGLTKEDERELEAAMQLERGTLRQAGPFWTDYKITFVDNKVEIDTEEPEGRLMYLFALAHPLIANNPKDLTKSNRYRYIIVDDEEEAKKTNAVRKNKAEAYIELSKLTQEDMYDILAVYGVNTQGLSINQVGAALGREVDNDHNKFLKIVGDVNLKTKILIMNAIHLGVLRKTPGVLEKATILYNEHVLGIGLEAAASNLVSRGAQGTFITIQRMVQARRDEISQDNLSAMSSNLDLTIGKEKDVDTDLDEKITKPRPKGRVITNEGTKASVKTIEEEGKSSASFDVSEEIL